MLRHLKILSGVLLVAAAVEQAGAFTIWGPLETFQTAALCYGTRYWYSPGFVLGAQPTVPGGVSYIEQGGPKNFGEGSRLNVPTITYAYDYNFLKYFGVDGVKAVDAAFAILNRLPAVSKASADLTEFIQQGNQQVNYTARALEMLDLKSTVLQLMMEHMGLLGETHVFDIMLQTGPACGSYEYQVAVRNYDPITWNPSTYVNGTLYDFYILDGCASGAAFADAMEEAYQGDPSGLSLGTSAVATAEALQIGGYYLGITRDDFGGLRYLYNQNNFNNETMPSNSWVSTNGLGGTWSPVEATNTLVTGWSGTVGGVEKFTFVKVAYDSYVGNTFPTNVVSYTLPILTNFQRQKLQVWRTNNAPDIVFTAANLLGTPGGGEDQPLTRSNTFLAAPVAPVNAASTVSEVIMPGMVVTLNNVGPIYVAVNQNFLQGSSVFLFPFFQFGSFDGSTNAPIAFPTGTSVAELISLELNPPPSLLQSPWNSVVSTNTVAGGGTGGGAAGGGGGTTTGGGAAAAATRARAAGSNDP
ncbi:MAG: hypothetical protein ABSG78_03490 [Verrucomicrobiota bacterium]|jgi:hypothetical protein